MSNRAEGVRAAFKYLFPGELIALQSIARLLPPNPLIINIGAGAGTSGLAFFESRPDVSLITIDIQEEDSPLGCLYAEKKVMFDAGYGEYFNTARWVQVHEPSIQVGERWADSYSQPLIDLVFVDGDHSYEGCYGDINAWWRNIKPDGFMAIHDYEKHNIQTGGDGYHEDGPHPMNWPDVDRAVNQLLLGHYPRIVHVDSLIIFQRWESE